MSKTCKHNNMTEILPYLWIGGTKKHTETSVAMYAKAQMPWRVIVKETAPNKSAANTHYFVCQNYGVPSDSNEYWKYQVRRYESNCFWGMATIVTDLGGHGRSGLYCAIIMAHVLGISGQDAIARLRQMHCEQAVETAEQEAYIVRIADELKEYSGRNRSA